MADDSRSRYPEVGVAVTKSSNWLTLRVGTVETKSSTRLPVITETRPDITDPGRAIICTGRGNIGDWGQLAIITTGLMTLTWEVQTGTGIPSLEGEQEGLLTVHAILISLDTHDNPQETDQCSDRSSVANTSPGLDTRLTNQCPRSEGRNPMRGNPLKHIRNLLSPRWQGSNTLTSHVTTENQLILPAVASTSSVLLPFYSSSCCESCGDCWKLVGCC